MKKNFTAEVHPFSFSIQQLAAAAKVVTIDRP